MSYSETKKIWCPLESNPEVLNDYIKKLGVTGNWGFSDLWGFDNEALMYVEQPCKAVLLLFPVNKENEEFSKQENEKIKKDGQVVSEDIYYSLQTIPNACGTMAILHGLLNNRDSIDIGDKLLKKIYEDTKDLNPQEKAKYLEDSKELANVHTEYSNQGQTSVPSSDDDEVVLHYTCFIEKNGDMYELDGRRGFPINRGKCDNLLYDSVNAIKKVIERNPMNNEVNVLVLTPML